MRIRKKTTPRTAKKKMYHHPDLRRELVQSAIAFLKNHRAEDLSLREIARHLGVSHMAPYRHFSTKEDLLAAVIEDGFQRLTKMFDDATAQPGRKFTELFPELGKAYVQFVFTHPDQSRLMFSGLLCDPEKHPQAHKAGQEAFGRLLSMIEIGQKEGFLSAKDAPYLQALMVWSAVHGTAMLALENQFSMLDGIPEIQIDTFAQFMSERLLRGLK